MHSGSSLPPCSMPVRKSPVNTGCEDVIGQLAAIALAFFFSFPLCIFFLPSPLHLFLSSSAIKLCHCVFSPPELDEAGVGGYLNDLVCSDSTALFHCRSPSLISLMDYEQGNKNRGRQNDLCKPTRQQVQSNMKSQKEQIDKLISLEKIKPTQKIGI